MDATVQAFFSSGCGDDPIMSHDGDSGYNGVVVKPYAIQELSLTLESVIAWEGEESP